MDAQQLYREGRLDEAIAAMNAEVRKHPTDGDRRGFLAELSFLAGKLDKADAQLDILSDQDAQAAPMISLLRQLMRAEKTRRELYADGRPPEFLGRPTEAMQLRLLAITELRDGNSAAAVELLEQAEARRVATTGTCDGAAFDDLRDLDDLTADVFEVLTSTGKSYWVPFESVIAIEFRPPVRPRDLLWRRAAMEVRDGPEGEVFLPCIYADPDGVGDDAAKLARTTDWRGGDGAPVRGVGQRTYLVGEDARPMLEIGELRFEGSGA